MQTIQSAVDEPAAAAAFETFARTWQTRYPATIGLWRAHWPRFAALWRLPLEIRRVVLCTNQIEATNAALRKVVRQHGYFPSAQAALATLCLAAQEARPGTGAQMPRRKQALQAFTVHFEGRLPLP